jgi:hypothetical protein
MAERWRSSAARDLVKSVRKAGGEVERAGVGKMKVTGPKGTVTIAEPTSDSRKDVARNSAAKVILDKTGLELR